MLKCSVFKVALLWARVNGSIWRSIELFIRCHHNKLSRPPAVSLPQEAFLYNSFWSNLVARLALKSDYKLEIHQKAHQGCAGRGVYLHTFLCVFFAYMLPAQFSNTALLLCRNTANKNKTIQQLGLLQQICHFVNPVHFTINVRQ